MKTKRIFIAIKITNTDEISKVFRQVGLELKEEKIKWVDKNGLHVTLLFLGTKNLVEIETIKNKLNGIANEFTAFRLRLRSLGAFPSINQPRILWAGINSASTLFELQKAILYHLINHMPAEDYKYSPHLTIGRIKGGVKNPDRVKECILKWNEWEDCELLITEFVLMESVLTQKGPVYDVLETFRLKRQNV